MEAVIKETIRQMIIDGELDICLVNDRDDYYTPKYRLKLVVKKDNKTESNTFGGIESEEIINWLKNEENIHY